MCFFKKKKNKSEEQKKETEMARYKCVYAGPEYFAAKDPAEKKKDIMAEAAGVYAGPSYFEGIDKDALDNTDESKNYPANHGEGDEV